MTGDHIWPKGTFGLAFPQFLERHGLEARGDVEPLLGGEDNRIGRIATDRGDVVIREYLNSGLDKVRAELDLVGHLARDGFPTPGPVPSLIGEPVAVVGGNPIAVFPFVPGDVPAAMTPDLARQCGTLLARMHAGTEDWTDERIPVIDRRGILEQAADSDVDLAGADRWRTETRAFLDRHAEDLALLDGLPSGPIHHDLHRQNLLVEDGDVTAVLDFDELNRGPLLIDLARCLHYLALEQPDRRLPAALAQAVIAGYEHVRPLRITELELLPLAFDLAGIVDAAGCIMWAAPRLGLTGVDDCHSWQAYLANREAR
ncbi:phosphotransferase [Glycomyces sp. TRM65418]|uniref:phosphotransferase enzyme family protein n=1 Tax=Glycomyces sp. TRM65418 TaxID=2867006 RepID=UPI001CE6298C|nr:phosphotransferase [Glycomyces sp. TRM65418]MCC3764178.1 phosphotransferase [Glycomyces sp. TRM65418]QZD53862.1 phosphotransferase [Glycomyces sp. TRM65418]